MIYRLTCYTIYLHYGRGSEIRHTPSDLMEGVSIVKEVVGLYYSHPIVSVLGEFLGSTEPAPILITSLSVVL